MQNSKRDKKKGYWPDKHSFDSVSDWRNQPHHRISTSELVATEIGQQISKAISNHLCVDIVYCKDDGTISERRIRPLEAFKVAGVAYISAFCYKCNEERTFRLRRIQSATCEDVPGSGKDGEQNNFIDNKGQALDGGSDASRISGLPRGGCLITTIIILTIAFSLSSTLFQCLR